MYCQWLFRQTVHESFIQTVGTYSITLTERGEKLVKYSRRARIPPYPVFLVKLENMVNGE